jgi:peptidoglycan biosynthesis protein MviN/MurJ (putative lipid II flippase)
MILSFFLALTCIDRAMAGLLLIIEETKTASLITATNVALGIIVALFLVPSFGIEGAALVRGITMVVGLLLLVWILRKKINLAIDKKAFWKALLASGVMAVGMIISVHFVKASSLLPLHLLVGAGIYFGMLKILKAVKKTDIELTKLYLGRRLSFLLKPFERFFVGKENLD